MQIIKQADGINSLTGPKNVDVGDLARTITVLILAAGNTHCLLPLMIRHSSVRQRLFRWLTWYGSLGAVDS